MAPPGVGKIPAILTIVPQIILFACKRKYYSQRSSVFVGCLNITSWYYLITVFSKLCLRVNPYFQSMKNRLRRWRWTGSRVFFFFSFSFKLPFIITSLKKKICTHPVMLWLIFSSRQVIVNTLIYVCEKPCVTFPSHHSFSLHPSIWRHFAYNNADYCRFLRDFVDVW